MAKLVRETYESHVDCGLHEISDRKYQQNCSIGNVKEWQDR